MARVEKPIDISKMTDEQLRTYIQTAGKRANQRLVELEDNNMVSVAYTYVTSRMPQREVYTEVSKSGHLKFVVRTKKMSRAELEAQARNINTFLTAKTSTVKGHKASIDKAYDTLIKKHPKYSKIPREQLERLFTNRQWKDLKAKLGSDQVLTAVSRVSASDFMIDEIIKHTDDFDRAIQLDKMVEKIKREERNNKRRKKEKANRWISVSDDIIKEIFG